MIEMVVVIVIIGILAAIAIPAASSAAQRSRATSVNASVSEIDRAIERYRGDHFGLSPAHEPDGSVQFDHELVRDRLTQRTDDRGRVDQSAIFGPYLSAIPKNPYSSCAWLRIGSESDRYGCSWLFDPETSRVRPDHMPNFWHDGSAH